MNRKQFQRRMSELAEQVMAETDPDKLLQLMRELDELFTAYLSNPPPRRESEHAEDARRLYKPTQTDIEWARSVLSLLNDGALIIMPNADLHYRVDHQNKELTLLNIDQLLLFDSFTVHLQTIATFEKLGYTVLERKPNGKDYPT